MPSKVLRIALSGEPAGPKKAAASMSVASAAMRVAMPVWTGMAGGAPSEPAHGIHEPPMSPTACSMLVVCGAPSPIVTESGSNGLPTMGEKETAGPAGVPPTVIGSSPEPPTVRRMP